MTETKDALDLPRIDETFSSHLSELPPVRWLDHRGCVRMGKLLLGPSSASRYSILFDELTHDVFCAHENEYEPNVQKDANGNPVLEGGT